MIPVLLIKYGPLALRVAKLVLVVAPQVLAIYHQHQRNKMADPTQIPPALPKPKFGRKYPNPFRKETK